MTTRHIDHLDLLPVIGCEIEKRPAGAPSIDDLAAIVLDVTRDEGALAISFPGGARATVEAFAAAERHCCGGMGWQVLTGDGVTLRITAGPKALDAMTQMFVAPHIESTQ